LNRLKRVRLAPGPARGAVSRERSALIDLLIGAGFVAVAITPSVLGSILRGRSRRAWY